jgi:uncharacterized C2H2 Zn-finger protein
VPETETFKPKISVTEDKSTRVCEVCGRECTGPGGLGAHMSSHYRKGEAVGPSSGPQAKWRCPHCDRLFSKKFLPRHIAKQHPTGMGVFKAGHLGKPLKEESLSAREVCRVVLEQALSDGKISLDALDAYEQWVQDTEKFLTVLYH